MDSNSGLPEAGAEPAPMVPPEPQLSAPISAPVDQPPLAVDGDRPVHCGGGVRGLGISSQRGLS